MGSGFRVSSATPPVFDGKQYDLKNSRNDTVTLQLVDPHTVDAIYRRDDQVTQKDRWVVSADGQQMTLTTTGTLETGQRVTEKLYLNGSSGWCIRQGHVTVLWSVTPGRAHGAQPR